MTALFHNYDIASEGGGLGEGEEQILPTNMHEGRETFYEAVKISPWGPSWPRPPPQIKASSRNQKTRK